MPIDREDGRHWCAPDLETADAQGQWTCECDQQWLYTEALGYPLWERPEDRQAREAAEAEA